MQCEFCGPECTARNYIVSYYTNVVASSVVWNIELGTIQSYYTYIVTSACNLEMYSQELLCPTTPMQCECMHCKKSRVDST